MAEIVTCPTCGGEAVLDSGVYQSSISAETLARYEANVRRQAFREAIEVLERMRRDHEAGQFGSQEFHRHAVAVLTVAIRRLGELAGRG